MKAMNYEVNIADLSPQLQVLIQLELRQNELEKQLKQKNIQMSMNFNDNPVPASVVADTAPGKTVIPDIFISNNDWRKDMNTLVCAIEHHTKNYSSLRTSIYRELESRTKCDLQRRLVNIRKNALYNGSTPSEAQKKNYLDVIEKDPKLISCYVTIVKEIAALNNIPFKQGKVEVKS